MKKQTRFLATSPLLLDDLRDQCNCTTEHEVVQGSNRKAAGRHTIELADAICSGYWRMVKAEDFGLTTTWAKSYRLLCRRGPR